MGLVAAGALFLYAPASPVPTRSGSIQRDSLRVGTLTRSFASYVPAQVAPRPALVIALHGSMGSPEQMRRLTAYRFEQLADEHGFIVVYPQGYQGHWNDCRKQAPYSAKRLRIDDVSFMRELFAHFRSTHGVDSARVFAVGMSNGGHLSYRLALEAPDLVRAVAAVAANLPAGHNFDCTPKPGAVSVLIINGTEDPINPFKGGRVTVFGLGNRGDVLSSDASASYFAARNGIASAPTVERAPRPGGKATSTERTRWRSASGDEVVHLAIHGGGHAMPQPVTRAPRLLGRTDSLDAPAEIWRFFAAREGRVSELP